MHRLGHSIIPARDREALSAARAFDYPDGSTVAGSGLKRVQPNYSDSIIGAEIVDDIMAGSFAIRFFLEHGA